MPSRRRIGILAATAAAAAVACAGFVAGYPSVIYDSWGYYYLAGILRTAGLAGWPTDVRTYGYPLFAAVVTGFRDLPPEEFRLIVFAAQLAALFVATALAARRLGRVLGSPGFAATAYVLGVLNPVLLLHASEPLSDLLSALLILLAVAFSWRAPDPRGKGESAGAPFLAFLCAGAAVAVRPANVVVLAALAVVWIARAIRWRDLGVRHAAAAAAGVLPPILPQMWINHRMFGSFNPLIQRHLYSEQASWGMGALKYATLVIPDRSPFLIYVNPFYRGDPSPRVFLEKHPLGYAATLALHGFGILDHDFPFTYVTDLEPSFRGLLAASNFLLLYLAAAGAFAVAVRALLRRELDEGAFAVAATALVAGAYAALYLPVEIESRFGLPLQALAAPMIACGFAALAGPGRLQRVSRALVVAGAVPCVAAALWLSGWIEGHRTNPFIESPANSSVMGPPRTRPPHPSPR
ncbi:MAG TPA: hypothetical protein VKG23_06315 [Thermoanaerobaculia bacterium]|nr:hypothetical protein [Thermoanaerobaculia bacterium]